jgi:hypothetical protein
MAGGIGYVVECLPGMLETLDSLPGTEKKSTDTAADKF